MFGDEGILMRISGKWELIPVEDLYDHGRALFLKGKLTEAVRWFTKIYERDAAFRDVAQIVQDYHTIDRKLWAAKYHQRLQNPDKPSAEQVETPNERHEHRFQI